MALESDSPTCCINSKGSINTNSVSSNRTTNPGSSTSSSWVPSSGRLCGMLVTVMAVVVCVLVMLPSPADGQLDHPNRLKPPATYFIVVPKKIRPDMVVQLSISILAMPYAEFVITAVIHKDGDEYASLEEYFTEPTSRISAMKLHPGAEGGNYTMILTGYTNSMQTGVIFQNKTELEFQQKHVSVHIQTDQWVYQKRNAMKFRLYAYLPNLIPVPSGSVDIYVSDGGGRVVRRWLFQQVRNGYLEGSFETWHPAKHGWWTIEVQGWGEVYKHHFKTENHFPTRFDMNISIPDHIYEDDFGLAGMMVTNETESGVPIHGNATIQLEIRPPGEEDPEKFFWLTQNFEMFTGVVHFMFPLSDVKALSPELAGMELVVHGAVLDWYGLEYKDDAIAYCYVQKRAYFVEYLGGDVRTFKPGSYLPVYISVFSEDGYRFDKKYYNTVFITTTVRKVTGQVTVYDEMGYLIPEDSIVRYQYKTEEDDQTVEVRAAYGGDKSNQKLLVATRHYSDKNEYLMLTTSTPDARTDNYIVFTVIASIFMTEIRYVVSSKGNIITASILYMNARQKTFAISASKDMIPEATIVVYGMLNSGDIIADSMNFHVEGIRSDLGMNVTINEGKDFTRDTVEFIGTTDPSTFIAYTAEDYEFTKRGVNNFLTRYKVEQDLLQYTEGSNTSFKHTWYNDEGIVENVFFNSPSSAIDANETFVYAGLEVFTDAKLGRIPGADFCNYTLGELPCFTDGLCYMVNQRCNFAWDCIDGADEMGCPKPPQLNRRNYVHEIYRIWDHMDSRAWAWQGFYTMPNGRLELQIDVPIRPTTWLVQAIALGTVNGIAFNEVPARMSSTRGFFIILEAPKSCFLGEQLGVQVAVFNYHHQPLETMLTLADSESYVFVMGEDYGIVSSYNPRTTRGNIQTMVYLQPGEMRFMHFPILPIVRQAKFTVTVYADSVVRRQAASKEISVSYDGVTNFYQTPYLIDLVNSGSIHIPHLYIPVPERFVVPGQREHLYVPGSGICNVHLSGDMVGPAFTIPHLDHPDIFNEKVHGDAQDYLFVIGINMYLLKFLDQVNQLDRDTLENALKGMNMDLNPVYAFIIEPQGAMSMRRKQSPLSVWLSAMALDILSKCSYQEWDYILYIDVAILNKMAKWVTRHQNETTGAYWETSLNFDHKMRSNMTNEYGMPMNMSLTAHVIIGLESATTKLQGEAKALADHSIAIGADYIWQNFHRLTSPWEICICTYALHLAGHDGRAEAFVRLREIARTDHYMYWAEAPLPPQATETIDNIPYRYANYMPYPIQSKAIHGTAMALEVYLINNWIRESVPIMKWLQENRNFEHGFDGTQDTLAALQALIKFAERETNREFYNMAVNIISTSTDNWERNFVMERGQVDGYETASIPNVWGSVYSTAEGTGYSIIQMETQVKVEYPWQLRQPQVRAFDLEIEQLRFYGRNASLFEMNVCITWVATEYGDRSGAAILEVDIPTGWFVRKQQLRIYQRSGRIDSQRSRFASQKVVLYMDYIDTTRSCWYFPAERHLPVANGTIQHFIRIQDTYEPAFHNTTLFNTWDLFHVHICQVCGSFQCPYCRHYNSAPDNVSAYSLWRLITTALVTLYLTLGLLWTKINRFDT